MKYWIFLIVLSFIDFNGYSCVIRNEVCPPENCVAPNQCEYAMNTPLGCGASKICCSVIKSEFRTHCRHHGGECMIGFCNPRLVRNVVDCRNGTRCCVLV